MGAPRSVRLFVGATAVAGAAALATAALAARDQNLPIVIVLAFALALALTHAYPVLMLHRKETEELDLGEAFVVSMALLLPPAGVVLGAAIGTMIGLAARRGELLKTVFNLGQVTVSTAAAVVVMQLIAPYSGQVDANHLIAAVAGAAVFLLVQSGAVSGVIALAEGRSAISTFTDGLTIRTVVWAGNVSAGLLAGMVGRSDPWALAFAVVPIGVLHAVFGDHMRARRDRERMNGLFDTAVKAHASMGIRDVERSIAESARSILRCEEARFDTQGPKEGELGAPLNFGVNGTRWLIVAERRGVEPFDAADENLLEAIVAIGAAALENASLYRQAEDEREKLADVVGSSSDGIFSVNAEGNVSSWNPAMESITGFSTQEMVGTRHLGAMRPRDAEGRDVMINGWTKKGIKPPADLQILTSRGEIRWLNCTFSTLQEGGYVTVARDITAQKQIDELKADFLATVSHELRTPLTPIQGFLMTLLRSDGDFPPEDRRNFYSIMLGQSERLSRLVEDLLEAVSLEQDGRQYVCDDFDWAVTSHDLVDLMKSQHSDREFVFEMLGQIPHAYANERRAEQVLSNLLTNAVKYTDPAWPIRVTVATYDDSITTTVADRGPGIAESDRERIFERFTRLGDHMTRKVGGVGLGLYIARRLVEGMGGKIWVEHEPAGGAQFKFTIPCVLTDHLSSV